MDNGIELQFALRAPGSGPLAAVICALADWLEDPACNGQHRALIARLLAQGEVPGALADRAQHRLMSYADQVEALHGAVFNGDMAERPALRAVV
jgi:hypothetical protein